MMSRALLVLSSSDVATITSTFSSTSLMDLMAEAFMLSSLPYSGVDNAEEQSAYTPHRTSIPSREHTVLFMPARIAPSISSDIANAGTDHKVLGGTTIKVVSVPRGASLARGNPATTLVLDEDTGCIKAVLNAGYLTALRTAAGSLLSTDLIGPSNPTSVVAFGAGKQIQVHLHLHLQHYPSLRTCTIVTRSASSSNVHDLKSMLKQRFDSVEFKYITYSPSSASEEDTEEDVKKSLLDASIIICATSSTQPLFPSSWVRGGTHVILVGSFKPEMREVDKELVLRAVSDVGSESRYEGGSRGMLLVDSRPACQVEAGDIISAGVRGDSMVEIGELCSRRAPTGVRPVSKVEFRGERTTESPITLFKSVGLGIQDVAIACAVVKRAEEMGVGTYIQNYDV